jgi:heavy metal sensor kinase
VIRSFRLRLTLWYLGFFSLLTLLFGVFVYGRLAAGLERRVDETLASQARTAATLFADEYQEQHGDAARAAAEIVENDLRGQRIAIFTGARWLASSGPATPAQYAAMAARAPRESGPVSLVPVPGLGPAGSRAAIHRREVDGRGYVIVACQPLDSVAADLRLVREVLFLATPLLLALAGLGGYLVARRSLAPLGWMAEQARRISGSNLDTRLEIGRAAEELETLAGAFNELLARLDQTFGSMRRFVADASHELRTPIAVIRGEADVALSQERSAAAYRETLAVILDESRRLSRLVDDLLNLARADAGSVQLQVREFYFGDLLRDCCRSVQALAEQRGIAVECRSPEDVPYRGDEELLHRLAMNLLDNAIRHTPAGGRVLVSLETVPLETGGAGLRIAVSDTGTGIAPEALPHLFDRFYRGDRARSRQDGGFGLGLAIVKWVAESHGGSVGVRSQPGSGSTFTVTLPR